MRAGAGGIFIAHNIVVISVRGHSKGRESPVSVREEDVFIYRGVQSVVSSIYLA